MEHNHLLNPESHTLLKYIFISLKTANRINVTCFKNTITGNVTNTVVKTVIFEHLESSRLTASRKGLNIFLLLQTSVVITEKYNVVVNRVELIGATEYLAQQMDCRINHCCYNVYTY